MTKPVVIMFLCVLLTLPVVAQSEIPPADILNDEGGVVRLVGEAFPSTPRLRSFGSQPVVFLGDISGVFVEDGFDFSTEYLNLQSPQQLAYTRGNLRLEPLRFEIALPLEPGGTMTDLSRDGTAGGVGVYTVNFTFNGIDDPFIDAREFIAYSSITYSRDYETLYQLNGGKILIYAPEAGAAFPAGYGADGELFTQDDPLVTVPAGYTVVEISAEPFIFDRSREVRMDILESEGSQFDDFSNLTFTEAFDAMAAMMRKEYAFTEFKGVDWDALIAEYRPQVVTAEANGDMVVYSRAVDGFLKSIPDGHVGSNALLSFTGDYFADAGGGVGLSLVELDDGRFLVNFVTPNSPAAIAGIEVGAEVILINGLPMEAVLENEVGWFGPYSTDHNRRLEQVRFATRFGLGEDVTITYWNPDSPAPVTAPMTATQENESFFASPFDIDLTGFELPVVHEILPSGYGYIAIYTFSDDNFLTLLLWERAMRDFMEAGVPGIVIDMRVNGGGSPDISNVMLGYLLPEETYTGTSAYYFPDLDTFQFDPLYDQVIYPDDEITYTGDIVVLVSPTCYSACEFFTYALTLRDYVEVVGYYPTGGLGGGIKQFAMPADITAQFTVGRAVGADNEIHIEGTGVIPTQLVPRTAENLFSEDDPLLETAIEMLRP